MKRATLVLAALALVLGRVGQARAGILPTHAIVDAWLPTSNGSTTVSMQGDGSLTTGLQLWQQKIYNTDTGQLIGVNGGSAQAIANTIGSELLGASATGSGQPGIGGDTALAAWRDVAFVGANAPPSVIRLNFSVDGVLFGGNVYPGASSFSSYSYLAVGTNSSNPSSYFNDYTSLDSPDTYSFAGPVAYFGLNNTFYGGPPLGYSTGGGWDTARFGGPDFRGTFHIDSSYDPSTGGYDWEVALWAGAFAQSSDESANALNTMSLQSVTLTDGTPVSGVTFDSGLTFGPASATPEPSTLTLLGIGAVCSLGYGRRWRKQARS